MSRSGDIRNSRCQCVKPSSTLGGDNCYLEKYPRDEGELGSALEWEMQFSTSWVELADTYLSKDSTSGSSEGKSTLCHRASGTRESGGKMGYAFRTESLVQRVRRVKASLGKQVPNLTGLFSSSHPFFHPPVLSPPCL